MEFMTKTVIRLGHSPDSDDAFMFWGLASGRVESFLEFEHILRDIQTLNDWAMEGRLEFTAVSVHAYAHIADRYLMLRHGGSFGEKYGPMLIARPGFDKQKLGETVIAVPGELTSAFLQLNLYLSNPKYEVLPFDEIMPAVLSGSYDIGLIIHEGQLTWEEEGLECVADFGKWWHDGTGLPLPLGVNVVRNDLGDDVIGEVSRALKESIKVGLENRDEALTYALQFARGLSRSTSDKFVGMYVNDRTLDMGDDGIRAVKLLLEKGASIGLVPSVEVKVVD
jgi:1,4-dihydroxy-6-naphthoate synthase